MEGHIPPHNLEAEMSVLGSVLLDSEVLDRMEGLLAPEAFYKEAHRKIWSAMRELRNRREPVDLVTLAEELRARNQLEEVGGVSYLVSLSENTPTAAYAEYYGRIVAEKWTLRRLIQAAGEAMRLAYEEAGSLEEILDRASQLVFDVAQQSPQQEAQRMRDLVHQTFEHIQRLQEHQGQPEGIRSGFHELDELIGELTKGSLNIIAARPSMGKTAFALSIAQNVALRERIGVAIFSLEMPAIQLVTRMLCSEARVDMNRLRQGQLSDRDFTRLVEAAGKLSEAPILIDDTPDLTLMELRARARRLRSQEPLGLIVIDYLQLMSGPTSGKNSGENRQQEIAAISRGLKSLARELELPIIALSQLSRAVEARPNKRPMLSDLRESGCLAGGSLVTLADGRLAPLASLVGTQPQVQAFNPTTQQLEPAQVQRAFATGIRPTFHLKTRSGLELQATGNHPFLTPQGWQRLDTLRPGTPLRTAWGWDPLCSLEPAGLAEVFDLTVPGLHNFLAGGLVAHNSIEQDADLVMFIYRDEYYSPHSEKAGIAEIIIGKQRNGPTGVVELQFHPQHVRFNNLAKDEL
jgi:replicative DNA helicase